MSLLDAKNKTVCQLENKTQNEIVNISHVKTSTPLFQILNKTISSVYDRIAQKIKEISLKRRILFYNMRDDIDEPLNYGNGIHGFEKLLPRI